MFIKVIVVACLISMLPSLAAAGELGALTAAQPAPQSAVASPLEVNLMPSQATESRMLVAANDLQAPPAEERPRKTHSGLTFSEFVDVHFGDYRWVYWAIAGGILIAIHAN